MARRRRGDLPSVAWPGGLCPICGERLPEVGMHECKGYYEEETMDDERVGADQEAEAGVEVVGDLLAGDGGWDRDEDDEAELIERDVGVLGELQAEYHDDAWDEEPEDPEELRAHAEQLVGLLDGLMGLQQLLEAAMDEEGAEQFEEEEVQIVLGPGRFRAVWINVPWEVFRGVGFWRTLWGLDIWINRFPLLKLLVLANALVWLALWLAVGR